MTTARMIIEDCLTFRLNRLSPGETMDADTAAVCLRALNALADEINGTKSFLFREILTNSSAINAASGTLGTTWTGLVSGDEILGATYSDGTDDYPLHPLTMQQYHEIADKTLTGTPEYFAHDGASSIYFYPVPTGQAVKLRTKQAVSDFADLDTDYTLPKGFRSGLADWLAERLAPTMLGGVPPAAAMAARAARQRLAVQTINPAIIGGAPVRPNILTGP